MQKPLIFSEDTYHKLGQNASIYLRQIERVIDSTRMDSETAVVPLWVVTGVQHDLEEWCQFASGFESFYNRQFKYGKRKICPNKDCASHYAYFYEDFRFCPKCGHELKEGVIEDYESE